MKDILRYSRGARGARARREACESVRGDVASERGDITHTCCASRSYHTLDKIPKQRQTVDCRHQSVRGKAAGKALLWIVEAGNEAAQMKPEGLQPASAAPLKAEP